MRQSMETAYNPAYRLINGQTQAGMRHQSDHNFIMNDGKREDCEVANITQPQNIVKLKDPKHIEGFGSDVVHVNVSCSQNQPDN